MWKRIADLKLSSRCIFSIMLLAVLILTGSGCASYTAAPPDKGKTPENPGYLVGTVTIVDGLYESWTDSLDTENSTSFLTYALYYRDADIFIVANSGSIRISGNVYSRTFAEHFRRPYGRSFIFSIPLEPGEYVFNDYTLYIGPGATWSAEEEFLIPFKINPGEVTYVGDWRGYTSKAEKKYLGMVQMDGGFWTNVDMKDEDLERIYAEHPALRELPLSVSVHSEMVEEYFGIADPLTKN